MARSSEPQPPSGDVPEIQNQQSDARGSLPTAPSLPSPAEVVPEKGSDPSDSSGISFDSFPAAQGSVEDPLIGVPPLNFGQEVASNFDQGPEPETVCPEELLSPRPAPNVSSVSDAASFFSPSTSNTDNILPIGGGYRLLRELGSGMFGEVWKAQRVLGGTHVAVKIIRSSALDGHAQQELKALEYVKGLRHPYLVQMQDIAIWENRLCIVMDLADGSLSDRAKHYRAQGSPGIPVDELLRYIGHAAEALDYLHSLQVYHRDIKPANILIVQGFARLADFGLARGVESLATLIDATGGGTPAYMPPEVWHNKVSLTSDEWSLAATYGELRLNRRLFQSRNVPALMNEICGGPPDLSPLPEAEQRVILKALSASTKDRYPACVDFVRALYDAVFPPPPPAPVQVPARATRSVSLWLSAIALVCFTAVIVAGIWLWSRRAGLQTDASPPARIDVAEQIDLPPVPTGRTTPVRLTLQRHGFTGPVRISCTDTDLPPTIRLLPYTLPEDKDIANLDLVVAADVRILQAHPHKVVLSLKGVNDGGEVVAERKVDLRFTIVYLPIGFHEANPSTDLEADGRGIGYYKRIECVREGLAPIPFVLIPQSPKPNLPTFYIMEHKVSLGQFREFVKRNPDKVSKERPAPWERGPGQDSQHPVLDVRVWEAQAFAEWLKGNLPTLNQWNKAAGFYEQKWEGPYRGKWEKGKSRIAIALTAPMHLEETADDVCERYGCRDMAGNGQEWVRTLYTEDDLVDFIPREGKAPGKPILLRGRSFGDSRPFSYEKMKNPLDDSASFNKIESEHNYRPGFRAVVE